MFSVLTTIKIRESFTKSYNHGNEYFQFSNSLGISVAMKKNAKAFFFI